MGAERVKPRVPRFPAPLVGYAAGCGMSAAGVFLLWGLAVALVVAGAVVAGSFVLAYAGDGRPTA